MKLIIVCLFLCHVFINVSSQQIQGRYRRPSCDNPSGCSLSEDHNGKDTYSAGDGYRSVGADGSPNLDKDSQPDKGTDLGYHGDDFDRGIGGGYNKPAIGMPGYNTKPVGEPSGHSPSGGYNYKPIRGGQGGYNTKPGSDRDYDAHDIKPGGGDYKPDQDRLDPRPGSDGYLPKPPADRDDHGYKPLPGGGGGGYRPSGNRDVNRPPRPGQNGGYPKPGDYDGSSGYRPQRPGQNGGYQKPGDYEEPKDGYRPPRPGQNGGYQKPGGYEESGGGHRPQRPGQNGGYQKPGGYEESGGEHRPQRPGQNGGYHKPGGYEESGGGNRPQRPGQNGGYQKPGGYEEPGVGHRPQRPGSNGGYQKPGGNEESRDPYYPNKDLGGYEDPKDDDYNDDKGIGGGIKDDFIDEAKPGNDGNCICVPYYQCQDGHIVTDGSGIIDARKKPQPDEELPLDGKFQPPTCGPFHVCCDAPETSTVKPYEHKCGVRNPSGINSRILSPSNKGEADFGEWPWQAAVLKSEGKVNIFMCGGVLIDKQHILTVAHCVFHLYKFNEYPLKVRLGEWDTQKTTEFLAHEDYRVSKIIVHPEYRNTSLWNDIAILRLEEPVLFAPHIDTICLPQYDDIFIEHNCVVTGWGKDAYKGGTFSNVMKEVALQVIDNYKCEEMLRKTRLGRFFNLHQGFMCAGGEYGLDSCKGDGGGPLVCYRKDKSYALAGLVSWGIDCGQPGVPGVYVKIQKYLDWISKNTGAELQSYWPRH